MNLRIKHLDTRGFSLVEVMVALGIFSVLSMGGVFLVQWLASSSATALSITDSLISDISVRGLQNQLERSQVMRKKAVSCEAPGVMAEGVAANNVLLSKVGDRFTFAYSKSSMIVATDTQNTNSILVPGVFKLNVGDLVLLQSVDSQGRKGFFKVKEIFKSDQRATLEVADKATTLPSEIPCRLILEGQPDMINPLGPRKYSMDVVEFISYQMAAGVDNASHKSLMGKRYRNFYSNDYMTDMALNNVVSLAIQQNFTKVIASGSEESGEYRATMDLSYTEPQVMGQVQDVEKKIQVVGGYSLSGSSLFNEYTSTSLPINEEVYPTCGLSVVSMDNYFIDHSVPKTHDGYGAKISLARLEAVYTEAEILKGAMTPQIRATLAPLAVSANPIRCWTDKDITWAASGPILKAPSLQNNINFEPIGLGTFTALATSSLVIPVFCSLPTDASYNAILNYTYQSNGDYKNKSITCTPTTASQTVPKTNIWSYVKNKESYCKTRTFNNKFLGDLKAADGRNITAPDLYLDDTSCTWNEMKWENMKNVIKNTYVNQPCAYWDLSSSLRAKGNIQLARMKLRPQNIIIQNSAGVQLPMDIECTGGF